MCNSAAHNSRPNRESVRKQIGAAAARLIDARDGGRCVYCRRGAIETGTHMHLDHLNPTNGGTRDNALTGLVTACHRCNSKRQNLSLAVWARKASRELGLSFTAASVRAHARRIGA